jgi:hypothetical protein
MAKRYLVNLDLGGNQLLSARAHNNTSAPTAYGKGQLWFDSTNNRLNVYNGSSFDPLIIASGSVAYATDAGNSTTTSQTNFTSLTISSSNVATQAYVTSLGYVTSSGSVAYATNAGNSTTTSQTNFSALTISGSNVATQSYVTGLGYVTSSGSVAYATNAGNSTTTSQTSFASLAATNSTESTSTSTGALVVTGGAGIAKNVYIGGNLNVSGSAFISGSAFTVSSSNIVLNDPLLYLAHNNPANTSDLGIVVSFNNGTYQHAGVVRDATDGVWKIFSGVVPEPDTTVNFASAVYDQVALGGILIKSGSSTTASINSSGNISANTGSFTSLNISGSAVATQAYVLANSGVGTTTKYTGTISGNDSATSFTITHNLGSRDVTTQVYQTSATPDTQYSEVEVDIVRTSTSVVTVSFATAPATGVTYNVVVVG